MKVFYAPLGSLQKEGLFLTLFKSRHIDGLSEIQESIALDGLLNPIIVVKTGITFKVVDGQKRLKAIRLLSKSTRYKRAFSKVPCILQTENLAKSVARLGRPVLLNDQELAYNITRASRGSSSLLDISKRYACDLPIALQCLSLENLNRDVFKLFNKGAISLQQAAALSSFDDEEQQLEMLLKFGPTVNKTMASTLSKPKMLGSQHIATGSNGKPQNAVGATETTSIAA